jgi:hypothetical protein
MTEANTAMLVDLVTRTRETDHPVRWFIETGSAYGYTAERVAPLVEHYITIELGPDEYSGSLERLFRFPNVRLVFGDSPTRLAQICPQIPDPALFYLDAHQCGPDAPDHGVPPCPILRELDPIFARRQRDLILIDDARLLDVEPGWPTFEQIEKHVVDLCLLHGTSFSTTLLPDLVKIEPAAPWNP